MPDPVPYDEEGTYMDYVRQPFTVDMFYEKRGWRLPKQYPKLDWYQAIKAF